MKTLKPLFHAFVMNATEPPPITYTYCYNILSGETGDYVVNLTTPIIPIDDIGMLTTDKPYSIHIEEGVNRLYVGTERGMVYEFEFLNNDLITLTYLNQFNTDSGTAGCYDISFGDNGKKMYVGVYKYRDGLLREYTLSTPYSIENVTLTGTMYGPPSSMYYHKGTVFNPDGEIMYVLYGYYGSVDSYLYRYKLNTAWDITDVELLDSKHIWSNDTIQGLHVTKNGNQLITLDTYGYNIIVFNVDTPWGSTSGVGYELTIPTIIDGNSWAYCPDSTLENHYFGQWAANAEEKPEIKKYILDGNLITTCEERPF